MGRVQRGIVLELSCYCCGGTVFKNTKQEWNEIEGMHFLKDEKAKLTCEACGLEDILANLVPRGRYHEELID